MRVMHVFPNDLTNLKILAVLKQSYGEYTKTTLGRPYYALSFRVQGRVTFTCEEGCISADSGHVVLVPKNKPYTLQHETEKLYVVYFLTDTPLSSRIQILKSPSPSIMEKRFASLYALWSSVKPADRYRAYAEFYHIVSEIMITLETAPSNLQNERFGMVINYIHEHFRNTDLSVTQLADIFGTSESYFRRVFTEKFDRSPLQYVTDLRLKYARELLQTGDYSVSQAAYMSGFRDAKYFSRFVKKRLGISPGKIKHIPVDAQH